MSALPTPIENAIEALSNLPGIGQRSAERLVFTILRNEQDIDQKIAKSLQSLKANIIECQQCCQYAEASTDSGLCPICRDPRRNNQQICVVEQPLDLLAIERTGEYKGRYHVLHGVLSPINKIGPDQIRVNPLITRVTNNTGVREVIFALAGNVESEATAHFCTNQIKPIFTGKIVHLARGIPSGGDLDFLDAGTLSRAINDRREM